MKPGDELIFKPSDRRGVEHKVTVVSVGRKWAKLSNLHRADKETGWVDGGGYSSPGRVWTEEALRNQQYRAIQWGIIREHTYGKWDPPDWMSNDDLDQVAAILSKLERPIEEPQGDNPTTEQTPLA
jgi:hypothetical protein